MLLHSDSSFIIIIWIVSNVHGTRFMTRFVKGCTINFIYSFSKTFILHIDLLIVTTISVRNIPGLVWCQRERGVLE